MELELEFAFTTPPVMKVCAFFDVWKVPPVVIVPDEIRVDVAPFHSLPR